MKAWRFALASAPYGSFNGLVAIGLPYVLRQRGIAVERIAVIAALVQAPAIWFFLWGPVVDLGFRRRTWVVVLSVASAACAAAALARPATSIQSLAALLVIGSVFAQPVSSAIGGLVSAVVPNAQRGRTAGWCEAGIFVAGVITGAATVWSTGRAPAPVVAAGTAILIAAPAFAALAIPEPLPAAGNARQRVREMLDDLGATFARKDVWLGLLFCLSPVGAGALMNLFSAIASEFHASASTIVWTVVLSGVLTPVGALVGGVICDRFDRWLIYPISGLTAAAAAGVMMLAPLSPTAYLAGAAAYALTIGFCYAAFMALAFELVGANSPASGARFTVFMAATNVPVVYMLRLDGWGHARFGVHGMLAVDALSNLVFGLLLLTIAIVAGGHARAAGRTDSERAPTRRSISSTV